MIKRVYVGRKVFVTDPGHCGGHFKKGTVVIIGEVYGQDSFRVYEFKKEGFWWYCRKCVSPYKNKKKKL